MNKREKEVLELLYDDEQAVLKELEKQYRKTLDEINLKIRILQSDELTQSKVYQLQYQQALKKQIEGLVEKLHGDEYTTIQQYLHDSYTNGFVGTMYDMAGQGIPLILPIDQNAAVKAILTDSKINGSLYDALGVDTNNLKKKIRQEITRGIAGGMTYNDIARNIHATTKTPLSNARRIVQTEGHRIQQASTYDAQQASKAKGADVVKQWDSTLDGDTRPTHRKLDGQIREVDKPFEEDGKEAMFPGDFGDPSEDCNCRCVSLTRARWALDEDELQTLKDRAAFFELDKTKDFEDFKEKYLKASEVQIKAEQTEHIVRNKFGQTIIFDEKMDSEKWSESVDYIKQLADEYDTRLTAVKVGAKQAAGSLDMGGLMRLSSSEPSSAFHEFAHSIAMEDMTKVGLADDSAFWKEIRKIRTEYRKNVGDDTIRRISGYADSDNDISEFMAEAFTHAKMRELGITIPSKYGSDFTYSKKILDVVDRHFKKTIENTGKNDIIKLGNTEVRSWYVDQVAKIRERIDKTLPVTEQARQAFEERNRIRTEARNMMADAKTKAELDKAHPNPTFEELIKSKMERKGMTREEAIRDILETATKTNENVNRELGLGDD